MPRARLQCSLRSVRDLLVVSAADETYFPLLEGLVLSICDKPALFDLPIGILDVGLSEASRRWLAGRVTHIAAPGWDVPLRSEMPASFQANVSRPFLPRHFPGYAAYLWIDADAWIQDAEAVSVLRDAARGGRLAICEETDAGYVNAARGGALERFLARIYRESLGFFGRGDLHRRAPLNVGVFALEAEAPHWAAWQTRLREVLARKATFYAEQVALNAAVHRDRLAVTLLPASLNWCCGHGLPALDETSDLLVHPLPPFAPLHVVHMTSASKRTGHDLATTAGGWRRRSLAYDLRRA